MLNLSSLAAVGFMVSSLLGAVASPTVLRQATRKEVVRRMLLSDRTGSAKRAQTSQSPTCSFTNGFILTVGTDEYWTLSDSDPVGNTMVFSTAEASSANTFTLSSTGELLLASPASTVGWFAVVSTSGPEIYFDSSSLYDACPGCWDVLTCLTTYSAGACEVSCTNDAGVAGSWLLCSNFYNNYYVSITFPGQTVPDGCSSVAGPKAISAS